MSGESRNPVNRLLGAVVPRAVDAVDPEALLERVDLDALLERIDVNQVLDRIDVDRLLARIDVDALLDRIDVDAIVRRVDVDRLLTSVDVQSLVARAGINDLVAETTSGMADRTIDLARRQVLVADHAVSSAIDRILRRAATQPPDPMQRPAGPVSRLLAFLADGFAVATSFGLIASVLALLSSKFFGTAFEASGRTEPAWLAIYTVYAFLYFWGSVEIAGRTPGKALLGLRVVSATEGDLGAVRVALRTITLPLVFVLGLGAVPALIRSDRRALHDLIAGTREVVDWGGRQARLPGVIETWLARHQPEQEAAIDPTAS